MTSSVSAARSWVAMSVPSIRTATAVGAVNAGDQRGQRRLPGTGRADERDVLARGDVQVHSVQDRVPAVVGEADIADVHRRWCVRRRPLPARFVDTVDRNGEDADHTGQRGQPALHLVGHEQDLADRLEQAEDEEDAGGRLADGDLVGADQPVADREQADEPDELRRGEPGEEAVEDDAHEQAVPHHGPRGGGDAVEVGLGLAERDHRPGTAERSDHLVGTMSRDGHRLVEQGRGDTQVRPHCEHLDRDGDREAEQEARVDHGQADGGDRDREDGRRERGQDRRHGVRHVVDVVAGPGEQVAGAGPFDDRWR